MFSQPSEAEQHSCLILSSPGKCSDPNHLGCLLLNSLQFFGVFHILRILHWTQHCRCVLVRKSSPSLSANQSFSVWFLITADKGIQYLPGSVFTLTDQELCTHLLWQVTLRFLAAWVASFPVLYFSKFQDYQAVNTMGCWPNRIVSRCPHWMPPNRCDFLSHFSLASRCLTELQKTSPNNTGNTDRSSRRKKDSCNQSGRKLGHWCWE